MTKPHFYLSAVTLLTMVFSVHATDPKYIVSGTEESGIIVSDRQTHLDWEYASLELTDGPVAFVEALTHCMQLEYGGYDDWRVPSIVELSSLVDNKFDTPALNTTFFKGEFASYTGLWSATSVPASPANGYIIQFSETGDEYGQGGISQRPKSTMLGVMCVRDGV